MALRVVKNNHVGWDASNRPINEYVFAVSQASELPDNGLFTDENGQVHVIAHGSRAWAIQEKSVYGWDDGTGFTEWKLQFTMNG